MKIDVFLRSRSGWDAEGQERVQGFRARPRGDPWSEETSPSLRNNKKSHLGESFPIFFYLGRPWTLTPWGSRRVAGLPLQFYTLMYVCTHVRMYVRTYVRLYVHTYRSVGR